MSNRGQNLPFTTFRPLAWFLIGSFAFFLSFRALSFPLFASLKRCLPFCKLFARNFHFKRLYCLIQYFLYLGGYLLTTGQIYGFFRRIANRLFSLTYKRQNPGFAFRGLRSVFCLLGGVVCLLEYIRLAWVKFPVYALYDIITCVGYNITF